MEGKMKNCTPEWAKIVQWCELYNIWYFWNGFRPHPHLWSRVLCNDRKNKIASAIVRNEIFCEEFEGVTLFDKVRSSEIRKSLNIEPLLFRIERSQLRWFGHVSRMPQEKLPKQALLAKVKKASVGPRRTYGEDYSWASEDLRWNRLERQPSEMLNVVANRNVWRLNLELLPPATLTDMAEFWKKKID